MQALPLSPQKPTCLVFYPGDSCDLSIKEYNDLILQRQRQAWETSAIAPLQKQLADQQAVIIEQQKQIKTLQTKIKSQTMAVLQQEAHDRASLDLLGAIIGVGLAFLVAFAVFRKLARNIETPPRGQKSAASAGAW